LSRRSKIRLAGLRDLDFPPFGKLRVLFQVLAANVVAGHFSLARLVDKGHPVAGDVLAVTVRPLLNLNALDDVSHTGSDGSSSVQLSHGHGTPWLT